MRLFNRLSKETTGVIYIFLLIVHEHWRRTNDEVNLIVPGTSHQDISVSNAIVLRHDFALGVLGRSLGRIDANKLELALTPRS